MTNVNKMKKAEVFEVLKEKAQKFSNLLEKTEKDIVSNTVATYKKDPKKVTKADLIEALESLIKAEGQPKQTSFVGSENKVKSLKKAKDEPKKDSKESKEPKKVKETKSPKSKKETKPEVKSTKQSKKSRDMVEEFPEEINHPKLGKLEINFDIKNKEDLKSAIEDGKKLVFTMYWNKRQLRQFTYEQAGFLEEQPKEFEMDLDITKPVYIGKNQDVVYCLSTYTETMYTIPTANLEIVDGVRVSNGVEFQIYEVKK